MKDMPEWSAETPLRVVTGYHSIAETFFQKAGFEHVVLLTADGALEAHPAMGSADIILDLVSWGRLGSCRCSALSLIRGDLTYCMAVGLA